MTDGNLAAEIVDLLMRRVPVGIQVSAETRIAGGLGLDSVAILDFIMDLEDRFDISIPLDRVADVQTVADLSHAIETLMRAAG
ncbi:MAG: acyl carrier protein [Steroidobacteraceae bacterium]